MTGLESTVISLVGAYRLATGGNTWRRSGDSSGTHHPHSNNRLIPPALQTALCTQNPFYIWSDQNLTTEDGVLLFGTPVPRGADHVWDLGDDPVQAGNVCMPLCVKWINHVFEICMWCFPTMINQQPTGWRSLIDFVAHPVKMMMSAVPKNFEAIRLLLWHQTDDQQHVRGSVVVYSNTVPPWSTTWKPPTRRMAGCAPEARRSAKLFPIEASQMRWARKLISNRGSVFHPSSRRTFRYRASSTLDGKSNQSDRG